MFNSFVCEMSTEELQEIYSREGMTLKKMCPLVGCKSDITLRKLLHSRGIDTNRNKKIALQKRGNRTDEEFKKYLEYEYLIKKRSINSIASELNISSIIVSRYLNKYQIKKRTKSEQQSGRRSPNWKGGISFKKSNGYIERRVYNHPNANSRGCKYEHQMVAELKLGRYLKKGEVVHHIDLDKSNNSFDNLVVLSNADHLRVHNKIRHGMDPKEALKGVDIIIC